MIEINQQFSIQIHRAHLLSISKLHFQSTSCQRRTSQSKMFCKPLLYIIPFTSKTPIESHTTNSSRTRLVKQVGQFHSLNFAVIFLLNSTTAGKKIKNREKILFKIKIIVLADKCTKIVKITTNSWKQNENIAKLCVTSPVKCVNYMLWSSKVYRHKDFEFFNKKLIGNTTHILSEIKKIKMTMVPIIHNGWRDRI